MLILTRTIGERLCIGDDITLTVLAVNGSQVRVGIDAPAHVKVLREEVAQRQREVSEVSGGGKLPGQSRGHR